MAYVIKIKYENSLRRLTVQKNEFEDLSFFKLQSLIRKLFQLPTTAELAVTYTDTENDVVTMGSDQDVVDALVYQSLNPLRVYVTLVNAKSNPTPNPGKVENSAAADIDVPLKQFLRRLSSTSESVKKVVDAHEPSFAAASSSAQASAQASGLVENVLRTVSAQIAAAVKHGADAAASASTKPFGFGTSPSSQPSGPLATTSDTSSRTSDAFNAAAAAAASGQVETMKGSSESGNAVHFAVGCNVCGVNPIVGLRWKSNKKYDYDLCASCFTSHGKESDYTKIKESMLSTRQHYGPCGSHKLVMPGYPYHTTWKSHFHGDRPLGTRGPCGQGGRHHFGPMIGAGFRGKLDARFVRDVTMFDGTEVTPGTRFTKIWRLRNSGSIPWPAHTNLVPLGGDDLGNAAAVPLEIPDEGLAPEGEIDVAVDLVAPAKPGRYVFDWRLASPSGPRFGHRIWVVIQVVAETPSDQVPEEAAVSDDTLVQITDSVLDVTTQEASSEFGKGEVNRQLEPTMSFVNVEVPTAATEASVDPVAEAQSSKMEENEFQRHSAAVERDVSGEFSMVDVMFGSYRPEDFIQTTSKELVTEISSKEDVPIPAVAVEGTPIPAAAEKGTPISAASDVAGKDHLGVDRVEEKTAVIPSSFPEVEVNRADEGRITYPVLSVTRDEGPISYPVVDTLGVADVEGTDPQVDLAAPKGLLGKLEAMGFTNSKLNLELLEKNNLDLRSTLVDLCAVEEHWDSMLEELHEMGFCDTDMNRRLMLKNDGSVKRVVKELVHISGGV